MSLVEVGLHFHDLGERLFSMVQRAISVIEDANPVPEARFLMVRVSTLTDGKETETANLWIWEMTQRCLIGIVCLLQVVHHQIAMSWPALLVDS